MDTSTSVKFFWFSAFFLAQSLFVYTIAHSDEVPSEPSEERWQNQKQLRLHQRWGESVPTETAPPQRIVTKGQWREPITCRDMTPCNR